MLRLRIGKLNFIFAAELVLFVLIVTGLIPRVFALPLGIGLVISVLLLPLADAALFFILSIPLFIALPLSASFDNFNTWRVVSLALFMRWFWLFRRELLDELYEAGSVLIKRPKEFAKNYSSAVLIAGLFILACFSLLAAQDFIAGLKRIIYFGNISLVGIVLYDLANRNRLEISRAIKAISVSTLIMVFVGYMQIAVTYLIDIYQFIQIWGEGIQLRQFGTVWSDIAVRLGNTWFAYYGEQLSLRVFSLFPDSHSFPIFVLLGIPALLAVALPPLLKKTQEGIPMKRWFNTRTAKSIIYVPLAFLIVILSGTRGIWAASIGVVLLIPFWYTLVARKNNNVLRSRLILYISSYLVLFFMLFSVAYPIFTSPQFLLSKGDFGLLRNRIRSIIDFGETSNSQRIEIWRKSIQSIAARPLLGVGIGNFPVVLNQDIFLARAGSSAHNIYLHVGAEMGIVALILFCALLGSILTRLYRAYMRAVDPVPLVYFGAMLLFMPWVFIYSLTDVAVFDERSFLLVVISTAVIFAANRKSIDYV